MRNKIVATLHMVRGVPVLRLKSSDPNTVKKIKKLLHPRRNKWGPVDQNLTFEEKKSTKKTVEVECYFFRSMLSAI